MIAYAFLTLHLSLPISLLVSVYHIVYTSCNLFIVEFTSSYMCITVRLQSAGGALSAILSIFKHIKDVGFGIFTKLFSTGVIPICDYFSEILGIKDISNVNKVQERTYTI